MQLPIPSPDRVSSLHLLRFLAVLIVLCAPGTLVAEGEGKPVTLLDHRGREIRLAASPERVVALGPSVSQTVWALGAGTRLVGRSRFCVHPPEIKRVPEMGGIADPSLEAILGARADVVLALEFLPAAAASSLEQAGIPVATLSFSSLADVQASILKIGQLLGPAEATRAQHLLARLDTALEKGASQVAAARGNTAPPRMVILLETKRLYSAGGESYPGTFCRRLGAEFPTGMGSAWPELNREALLTWDPEIILLLASPDEMGPLAKESAAWRSDQYWGQLAAVKQGRVALLDHASIIVPGPRLEAGIPQLEAALYPEIFTEAAATELKSGRLAFPLKAGD